MWKPNESLDDFAAKPAPEVTREAPRSVSLQRSGEVEVLKPLTPMKVRAKRGRYSFKAPLQPLWFRRFLAVGSGALVMVGFVLVSAILVGINDPVAGPEVATTGESEYTLTQPEEPFSFDVFSLEPTANVAEIVRSHTRRRPVRPAIKLAVHKPRRQFRPPLQPEEPDFVPTTLVIYAENGVINSRIEPWFPDADKKTTFSN